MYNNIIFRFVSSYIFRYFSKIIFCYIILLSNLHILLNNIVYADDKTNGSVKHFGNLHTDFRENQRVYGIEDVTKIFKILFILIYDLF